MTDTPEERAVPGALRARPHALARRGGVGGGRGGCSRRGSAPAGARARIGVYRRETRDGRDVLGEVPDHPIDTSVGVVRVDDLDGRPIAVRLPLLRPSRHGREPVAGRLRRLPRARARGARAQPRRARALPPGVRRQRQPARRDRLRDRLPRHEEPRRPRARRRGAKGRSADPHEHPRRRAATARQRPQHPLHPLGAGRGPDTCTHLAAAETTVALDYDELPSLERAREILAHWQRTREERRAGDALDWEIRARPEVRALGREARRRGRGRASDARAPHPGDPRQRHRHRRAEHGDLLRDGPRDPGALAAPDTFVLGYTNGCFGYLPRGEDYPEGGWKHRRELRRARPDPAGVGDAGHPAPGLGAAGGRGDASS